MGRKLKAEESPSQRLERAAERAIARMGRTEQPDGQRVGGVWLPSEAERRACCDSVRPPEPTSGKRDYLLWHCRTLGHVAQLEGVAVAQLESLLRSRGITVRSLVRTKRESSRLPAHAYGSAAVKALEKERAALETAYAKVLDSLDSTLAALRVASRAAERSALFERFEQAGRKLKALLVDYAHVAEIHETLTRAIEASAPSPEHAKARPDRSKPLSRRSPGRQDQGN